MKLYELGPKDTDRYFELRIFPDADAMNAAIVQFCRDFDKDEGMVWPMEYRVDGEDTGLFAIMWLHEGALGAGLVAHECLHAALAFDRMVNGFGGDYGPDSGGDDEERLCGLQEEIMRSVTTVLYDEGHIKQDSTVAGRDG